ncbi:MAG: hypothetical protein JO149_00835 [Gammaproteobacteria bacterium]|nr:hypothetical protein [Gammaproteobacteria bacterium]
MERTTHRHNRHAHRNDFDLSADLEKIKTALADATYDVRGRAGEIFNESIENVKQKSTDIQGEMETYVTEKPFKSLGIAVLSGFLLGFLFHKK